MSDTDAKLKQALREKALQDLAAWNEQRLASIEKQKAKNRAAEALDIDEKAPTPSDGVSRWDKVHELIDFQMTSEKDTSRMKSILLSLKNSPTPAS